MKQLLPILCFGLLTLSATLQAQPCVPAITAYNGLSTNLLPVSGSDNDLLADDFRAVVHATDLVRAASSPCNQTLNYRIRKSGTGTGVPTTVDVFFDCSELGYQVVEIWAGDGPDVNWGYTETYVLVTDNKGYCETNPQDYSLDCGENDVIPPSLFVFNGLAATLQPKPNGQATAKVAVGNLVYSKSDNCPGIIKLRMRKSGTGSGVPSTTSVTFGCAELGTQSVEVWAGDAHNNWSVVESYVIVEDLNFCGTPVAAGCTPDLTPPDLLVYNGFSVNITPNLSGVKATVAAKMFTRQRQDNCAGPLTIRISKSGATATPPTTASVKFDCSELGTQLVDIWAIDQAGNWTYTETYIIVQDNSGNCGVSPKIAMPEWKSAMAIPAVQRGKQVEAVGGLSVWPNPTTGAFTLTSYLEQSDFVQVELYNALGQQVKTLSGSQWQEAGDVQYQFELGDLPSGLYRCALRTSTGVHSVSLIKN